MRTYNTRIKIRFYSLGFITNDNIFFEKIMDNSLDLEKELNVWAVVHGVQFVFETIAEKIAELEKHGIKFKEYQR